jgi:hypothetical protein
MITVGRKFRKTNHAKCHIVNIFIDESEEIVTYKQWSKRKKSWYYYSEPLELFMIQFSHGGAKWL